MIHTFRAFAAIFYAALIIVFGLGLAFDRQGVMDSDVPYLALLLLVLTTYFLVSILSQDARDKQLSETLDAMRKAQDRACQPDDAADGAKADR